MDHESREREEHQKLDELIAAMRRHLPRESDGATYGFAWRLFRRDLSRVLARRTLEETAADAAALYKLLDHAKGDPIAVRVAWDEEDPSRGSIQTVSRDRPFIVDTIREYLHSQAIDIEYIVHPVVVVHRTAKGRLLEFRDRPAEGPRYSVVQIAVEDAHDPDARAGLEAALERRLSQVRSVTDAFPHILERTKTVIKELTRTRRIRPDFADEVAETKALLRWLVDRGFVFLGYRGYTLSTDEDGREWMAADVGEGLGLLADDAKSSFATPQPVDTLRPEMQKRIAEGPLLIVSKTNAESPVRRRARMDYVGVRKVRRDGSLGGEFRFLGLFTAKAFSEHASEIPILRQKLAAILESESAPEGSHDYNLIVHTFNSIPKEELFSSGVEDLRGVIEVVRRTQGADDILVTAQPDTLGRGVNVLVVMPRNRFSGEVRRHLQAELVKAYEGDLLNYHLALGQGDQARLHFFLAPGGTKRSRDGDLGAEVDLRAVEAIVWSTVRTWEERLEDGLAELHGATKARRILAEVGQFPAEYQAAVDISTALEDVEDLRELGETDRIQVRLREVDEGDTDAAESSPASVRLQLRLVHHRDRFALSDIVPTLECLGLRVLETAHFKIAAPSHASAGAEGALLGGAVQIFDAEATQLRGVAADAENRVAEALRAIYDGEADNDSLNELILTAGLTYREVSVLRTYGGYAFRAGAVASRAGAVGPLTAHPRVARSLLKVFQARFDPAREAGDGAEAERELADGLVAVRGIEDDRTLRRMADLIKATVRTNYYRGELKSSPALVIKLDPRNLDFVPRPRPRHEVYMRGPQTEAAHIRMDDVARGGIRWSDRVEDFRVELLGLVKTQRVKNAVIVPGGAKGCFIVLHPPADQGERVGAGLESYRQFIRGMLEISDNVVDGEVVSPGGVVVHDEPDPYLVVAADKGTAKNSDTANQLALDAGFWLGDAFASGGSRGYDHKEEGITARGAWECVKRHFREARVDYENGTFTAAGIGDMGGDVFGNGMLLSRNLKLIGAFNHRHIFVDPDPDPAASWKERKRLFEMPRSSWADYNPELISDGGGVWERTNKRIKLSEAARTALGIERGEVNGEELVTAILRAPADLLWNGGIGTYVKASHETDADVGDPGNDRVRIDATELRVKVVGEGGNLGMTQKGRVQFALAGGRLNTDAVDNSAGVDMSDHEVNLKVLLSAPVARGDLSFDEATELLEDCTEAVSRSVLANNYYQSLSISLDARRAAAGPEVQLLTMETLQREGELDAVLEELPVGAEWTSREAIADGAGPLTRPELSVLMAYSKLHLKDAIVAAGAGDDPALMDLVRGYFPAKALEAVTPEDLTAHRLRSRIAATQLANRFVDRMGAASHIQLTRSTGRSAAAVALAWHAAWRVLDAEPLMSTVRQGEGALSPDVQYDIYLDLARVLRRMVLWILSRSPGQKAAIGMVEHLRGPVREIREELPRLLSPPQARLLSETERMARAAGFSAGDARRLGTLTWVDELLPVAALARSSGADATTAARAYFGLSSDVDFAWVKSSLSQLSGAGWGEAATRILLAKTEQARSQMAARVLADAASKSSTAATRRFRQRNAVALSRIRNLISDARSGVTAPGLDAMVVVVEEIAALGAGQADQPSAGNGVPPDRELLF